MFASKAGAKLVIGIDMSNILDQAEKIVRANGFTQDRTSSNFYWTAPAQLTLNVAVGGGEVGKQADKSQRSFW